jgi:hypothetical protein
MDVQKEGKGDSWFWREVLKGNLPFNKRRRNVTLSWEPHEQRQTCDIGMVEGKQILIDLKSLIKEIEPKRGHWEDIVSCFIKPSLGNYIQIELLKEMPESQENYR